MVEVDEVDEIVEVVEVDEVNKVVEVVEVVGVVEVVEIDQVDQVGYGKVEEVMSELNIVNESINEVGIELLGQLKIPLQSPKNTHKTLFSDHFFFTDFGFTN